MKKWFTLALTSVLVFSCLTVTSAKQPHNQKEHGKKFELGVDVLLHEQKDLIKGKRVGLVTNPTGVDKDLHSIVDLFAHDSDFKLTALYGPEHGVRGDAQAGAYVDFYTDSETGLPVYSLYGKTQKPTPEMLKDVDVLVFDIQDVGTRFYTYIYTMAYLLEAAKENGKKVIVLDRPNPIGGTQVEGPVLDASKYSSFIGKYAIPLRHGMTVGELANLFNTEFRIGADLTVVKMKGWKRDMYYDDTPLQFIMPSPNMPTLDTAVVYPGAGLFESTNLSEGRGTTRPFELIGAPYIDGTKLANALNNQNLPGVTFRATSFSPTFSKHMNLFINGVQIHVTDREKFNSVKTGLVMIKTIHDMYPNDFQFINGNNFELHIGIESVRQDLLNGISVDEIEKKWQPELKKFMKTREKYLLYK
ncbi:exo-beta-N-acetylmuramidase NamZ domain-containing protein [Bacillus sp. AFS041924]|uniref:exo-beta-N-acetylmuramidase NamZ family protein n=1 Tax=Bacillus sp. AFS041924 TaxID=2033503 RepID=UPI000BFDD297|nr:DUF1343 domain-containing protein [Bacillus sp. AFS041924]PGS54192.1 hypothetical protein COC46_05635 [Bacillus sp. AFS041924]